MIFDSEGAERFPCFGHFMADRCNDASDTEVSVSEFLQLEIQFFDRGIAEIIYGQLEIVQRIALDVKTDDFLFFL